MISVARRSKLQFRLLSDRPHKLQDAQTGESRRFCTCLAPVLPTARRGMPQKGATGLSPGLKPWAEGYSPLRGGPGVGRHDGWQNLPETIPLHARIKAPAAIKNPPIPSRAVR